MCKVYNTIGSLSKIKTHLRQNGIDDFNSVNQLISFQKNYATARQQVVLNQKTLLTAERDSLSVKIIELEGEIEREKNELRQKLNSKVEKLTQQHNELIDAQKSIVQELTYSFRNVFKLVHIECIRLFSNRFINATVKSKVKMLDEKRKRCQYLIANFEEAALEGGRQALDALDSRKRVIDEISTFIYGAIGEQKVVEELKQLPDDYTLINDFFILFDKPIFSKQQRSFIKSVQIDHLLISPAGIFLIETKNWRQQSLRNLSLRSPVEQIRRSNDALFKLLRRNINFGLDQHHWGERKLSIRNLIVLINHKPMEEFQYVKILTLAELLGFITYFKPSLSNQETREVADYLSQIANRDGYSSSSIRGLTHSHDEL